MFTTTYQNDVHINHAAVYINKEDNTWVNMGEGIRYFMVMGKQDHVWKKTWLYTYLHWYMPKAYGLNFISYCTLQHLHGEQQWIMRIYGSTRDAWSWHSAQLTPVIAIGQQLPRLFILAFNLIAFLNDFHNSINFHLLFASKHVKAFWHHICLPSVSFF